jgi:lysophospholipase L1-like esterase
MRKAAGLIISLGSLAVCFVLAELILRVFFADLPDPYEKYKYGNQKLNQYIKSEFPPDYHTFTLAEDGLPGVEGQKEFSINNMGFRGDHMILPKPEDEFRIFIVGGSTSECFYLDDSESIDKVLQTHLNKNRSQKLTTKVYNAGKSGDASDDHISMISHRMIHLEPDVIIVFSGINDLLRSMREYDYRHYVDKTLIRFPIWRSVATEFQIPRRIYYFKKRISPREAKQALEEITIKSNYMEKTELCRAARLTERRPLTDVPSYSRNLLTIIGMLESHNVQLVFVTQQTTWNSQLDTAVKNRHWLRYRDGVTYREDYMDEALEMLNDAMRRLAIDEGVPLYDLAKSMPKSLEYFYDDVHFNVRGADEGGRGLGAFLLEKVRLN